MARSGGGTERPMELGMIGLGRMGAGLTERLVRAGHRVTGFDPNGEARQRIEKFGARSAASLDTLVQSLKTPRVVWMMLPAGEITHATVLALQAQMSAGDTLIDGGNSNYKDTLQRAGMLAESGIHYVDCGTSGGVWGLAEGFSLMLGGEAEVIERLRPLLEALAAQQGWGRVGPVGAGHFTKMVHNGIEYGLMQAYAEGFSILRHKPEFDLDLHQIAGIWMHGSVVRSWLLQLTAAVLETNPKLEGIAPYVADSGEGRWTVAEAIDLDVPAPVITLALLERLRSRDSDSFTDKMLAAMRNQFGGHAVKTE